MKVFVKTFGCSSNRAESAAIEELLRAEGFDLVSSVTQSDAIVVNTCTVRSDTEHRVLNFLSTLSKRKVVVTGCMAEVQPSLIATQAPEFSIVSPHSLPSIPKALRTGSRAVNLKPCDTLPEPAPFQKGVNYTIAISRGCLGHCSYCIVRKARGHLVSLPEHRILSHVTAAVKGGAWEIRLSAQDTGVYGNDLGGSLPSLLNKITSIDGDFRVRLGMLNPSSLMRISKDLLVCYRSQKLYKFLHVPLQSGSDKILESMERCYTTRSFEEQISKFTSSYPGLTLFTDIIVGYPGETNEDFKRTCDLVKAIQPDKTHIARFSPRPLTEAFLMPQLPEAIKKQRSGALASLVEKIQIQKNRAWIGETLEATIVDRYLHGGMIARTDEYKTIALYDCPSTLLGRRVLVSVVSCTAFYLKGEIIRHLPVAG